MIIANVFANAEDRKDLADSPPATDTVLEANNALAPLSPAEKPQILAELIIEEVSIDGMCGVY
ncbi:MAG: mycofactocin precursor MftA [Chloroflexales bacterium]|nr:mycofactocin precursor MftA [Chloroflexales bacterium]